MIATITQLAGDAPVVGEGSLPDGKQFYFRSRGAQWSFSVGADADAAMDAPEWAWQEWYGDRPFEGSYMPQPIARAIIESCAQMRMQGTPPPGDYEGVPAELAAAERLAWFLLEDVAIYHGESSPAEISGARQEARDLFVQRVAPELAPIFDATFAQLDARLHDKSVHMAFVRDAASARSIGQRWAAMLLLLPASEREATRARGMRWFTMWAPDAGVRTVMLDALK